MRNFIRTFLIAGLLLGCGSIANAQVSFGIRIGPPPAVRTENRPPRPGPDFIWVRGYWYPDPDGDGHYAWHNGYWTRPPYEGANWVPPHRENGMFYDGYWNGSRGRVEHNHAWDGDQNRDYNRSDQNREDNDHGDNNHGDKNHQPNDQNNNRQYENQNGQYNDQNRQHNGNSQ